MLGRFHRAGRGRPLAAALAALSISATALADEMRVPAARVVIYPGDIISQSMLEEVSARDARSDSPFALSYADVVGKSSRRTLLPGYPIPLLALENPRLIRNGSPVKMVYVDGALSIETTGAAMQDGGAGDLILVRNVDSGVNVNGRVQPDGSVKVGD